MPEQDLGTGQLQQAENVLDVIFPAGHQASRVVQPRKEAFDPPPATVAPQGAAVADVSGMDGPAQCRAAVSCPSVVELLARRRGGHQRSAVADGEHRALRTVGALHQDACARR